MKVGRHCLTVSALCLAGLLSRVWLISMWLVAWPREEHMDSESDLGSNTSFVALDEPL
jgi:hypothetical protein